MIKINPSGVTSAAPELSSSDIQWQDFKVYFAVEVDHPHLPTSHSLWTGRTRRLLCLADIRQNDRSA